MSEINDCPIRGCQWCVLEAEAVEDLASLEQARYCTTCECVHWNGDAHVCADDKKGPADAH